MKEYKINLSAILSSAKRAEMRSGINSAIAEGEAIRKGIHFVETPDMRQKREAREAKAPNHYYVFCPHEIPYWRPCTKCKRDKNLAARNADLVLRACGGAAFFTK